MRKTINDIMEEVEEETRYIDSDGKHITLREAIDSVLCRDAERKRKLSEG